MSKENVHLWFACQYIIYSISITLKALSVSILTMFVVIFLFFFFKPTGFSIRLQFKRLSI